MTRRIAFLVGAVLLAVTGAAVILLRPVDRRDPALPPTPPAEPPPATAAEPADSEPTVARIVVHCPGLTAEEVEQIVCFPLEVALGRLDDLGPVRTRARAGQGTVELIVPPEADLDKAGRRVYDAAMQARSQLPTGAVMVFEKGHADRQPVLWMALAARDGGHDAGQLGAIVESRLRRAFLAVPDVGDIVARGGAAAVPRLQVDPVRLTAHKLTATDVLNAVRGAQAHVSVVLSLPRIDVQRLPDVMVGNSQEAPVYLRDVAVVERGVEQTSGALINGKVAVALGVKLLPGAAAGETVAAIRKQAARLRPELAAGLEITEAIDHTVADTLLLELRFPGATSAAQAGGLLQQADAIVDKLAVPGINTRLALWASEDETGRPAAHILLAPVPAAPWGATIRTVLAERLAGVAIRALVLPAQVRPPRFTAPLRLRVQGEDLDALSQGARAVCDALRRDTALADVDADDAAPVEQVRIIADPEKVAFFGIAREQLAEVKALALGGADAGGLAVRFHPLEVRQLPELLISRDEHPPVRLGNLAKVEMVAGPSVIRTWNGQRAVEIHVRPATGVSLQQARAAMNRTAATVSLPKGCRLTAVP